MIEKETFSPKLVEKTHLYEQEKDCCDGESDFVQYLELKSQDGGGGNYLVMKTERWAISIDEIDKFRQLLKDFLQGLE